MKLAKVLFVLALAVVIAAPAYAETQNVKVSGSIDAYWFYRNNYDLRDNNGIGVAGIGVTDYTGTAASAVDRSEGDDYFMSVTQIEIAADLTDNVSTVINLVNQRDWNSDVFTTDNSAGGENADDEFDVLLDLAYVQMKEIFYSPLTLTLGRQDIWLGRGFIIGNNNTAWDPNTSVAANEYSATTAFDAIRATLDFNPWTIDLIYSKIDENANNPEDDKDLWVAYVNYQFAEYNAVADLYYVGESDRATLSGTSGTNNNDTHTIGGRVQFDPISQITLGGELAFQFGDYHASLGATSRDRGAWALDIFGTYRWDNEWKPELTLEYVHFSGESDLTGTGDYDAWNFLYRGRFYTAYADFREVVYGTSDASDQAATQNQQFIQVKGALMPMEDLLLEAAFTYLWMDEDVSGRDDEIGWEIDLVATYDYTEDVTFGLLVGWFETGDFYTSPNDELATDIVASAKVTF